MKVLFIHLRHVHWWTLQIFGSKIPHQVAEITSAACRQQDLGPYSALGLTRNRIIVYFWLTCLMKPLKRMLTFYWPQRVSLSRFIGAAVTAAAAAARLYAWRGCDATRTTIAAGASINTVGVEESSQKATELCLHWPGSRTTAGHVTLTAHVPSGIANRISW